MRSLQDSVARRIRGKGRGWVFVARDFLDLGSRAAVDQALSRLARDGTIRRVGHGIYDLPKVHPRLGKLAPPADAVARAAARATRSKLQVSGAHAANALGLSLQVPARHVYLTDGTARRLQAGPYTILFKHVSPKNLLRPGTATGSLFQALRYLGSNGVDDAVIDILRSRLDSKTKRDFQALRDDLPLWMRPIADQLQPPESNRPARPGRSRR